MELLNDNDEVVSKEELIKIFDSLVGSKIRKFKNSYIYQKGDVVCDDNFNLYKSKRYGESTTLNTNDWIQLKLGTGSVGSFQDLKKKLTNG